MMFPKKDGTFGDRRLTVDQENRLLESQIRAKGGISGSASGIDPHLHNMFLRRVLAVEEEMESGNERLIGSLLPEGYEVPPPGRLSGDELTAKLDDILDKLEEHGVDVHLLEETPDEVVYRYVVEQVLPEKEVFSRTTRVVFIGCTGDCPSCIQEPYCTTAAELDGEEKQ